MVVGNPHTSIITLNVNALNLLIKRQGTRLNKRPKPSHILPSGVLFQLQRQIQTQSKTVENNSTNGIHRKAIVAIIISNKIDFKITKVKRDEHGHFLMIKRTIPQERRVILNMFVYVPNLGANT